MVTRILYGERQEELAVQLFTPLNTISIQRSSRLDEDVWWVEVEGVLCVAEERDLVMVLLDEVGSRFKGRVFLIESVGEGVLRLSVKKEL